ncbi:MAG: hypothetical protein JNL02_18405 [Saprospiraceae bacterium]|nr:hypothetical protein [Saprospiraceae bacterium]
MDILLWSAFAHRNRSAGKEFKPRQAGWKTKTPGPKRYHSVKTKKYSLAGKTFPNWHTFGWSIIASYNRNGLVKKPGAGRAPGFILCMAQVAI